VSTLKPTLGRLPCSGQASDGGLAGIVGVAGTTGFLTRTPEDLAVVMRVATEEAARLSSSLNDARLAPMSWRESEAGQNGRRLRIGWFVFDEARASPLCDGFLSAGMTMTGFTRPLRA